MNFVSLLNTSVSIGTIAFQIVFVILLGSLVLKRTTVLNWISNYSNHLVFFLSLIVLIGSMMYSTVIGYPPCDLCWYQRIALYPLVLISGYELFKKTNMLAPLGIMFSAIGTIVALYHNIGFWTNSSTLPCSSGISCLTQYVNEFNYVTIPLMSLTLGALITLILAIRLRRNS
jgi:disulfide bond formation protein DsbB